MSDVDGFDPSLYTLDPDGNLVEKKEQTGAKWRRDLERRAKKGDEAMNRLAEMERKLALRDAGIPNNKQGELFMKAYEGPMDDPAAIKAAWDDIFPTAPDPRIAQALDGNQQSMELAAGAQVPPPGGPPNEAAIRAKAEEIKAKYRAPGSWETGKEEAKRALHEMLGPDILDKWGLTGRQH